MEEYITRAEFEQFKRHVEQKTEEMKAIRVDVHNIDVETLKQELKTVSDTWLNTLQEHYNDHTARFETLQADIFKLRESQADFRDKLETVSTKEDIGTLETRLSKIESTQEQILKLLQQKSGE